MRESVLVRIDYIGETKRKVLLFEMSMKIQTKIQNQPNISFNTLFQHSDHVFLWKVLMSAPMNNRKRKNLEAFFIAVKHLLWCGGYHYYTTSLNKV